MAGSPSENAALDNLRTVAGRGLCTRCGTCVGLGKGRVEFRDELGECLPDFSDDLPEGLAESIWQGCSGWEVDFPALNRLSFGGDADRHPYLGHFSRLLIGHAMDEKVRAGAASGGFLSAVQLHLLDTGRVDGVVTVGMDSEEPFRSRPFIATTPEEVLSAAQSKYSITSVNTILPEIEAFDGRIAYVGLPCQVHSLRKLQAAGHPAVRSIEYVLGPFCGNTLHFSSVLSFLRSNGIDGPERVTGLEYRAGEWPGNMRVTLDDGRLIELPKFHANYLIPFHIMQRCLLCTDLANEFTDLAGGDAWAPKYEQRGQGFSFVVSRSRKGDEVIDEMTAAGLLDLRPAGLDEALEMHSHGYDLKKRGAFIRLRRRAKKGPAPRYGYDLPEPPWKRRVFESVLGGIFRVCRWRASRSLVDKIPQRWMGRLFVFARTVWKRMTRSVKRDELGKV